MGYRIHVEHLHLGTSENCIGRGGTLTAFHMTGDKGDLTFSLPILSQTIPTDQ
jgi:hypothetical protein